MEEDRLERQTILIVDDSEMNRMMLTEILGAHYQYIEAENGRQAIHLLQKNLMVDLILLDIHMPEMDGFQVLEQLNRAQWMDEIPVIMISAEDSGETIKRAYSMGVTDYIQRPFDAFIVRRRIENTLKLYANQKRLMKLVSDQIYEKEENNNLMVGILNHVVEFRTHEGEEYNRNIRSATELLLRRLIQKTDSYHLSEEDIVLIKMASAIRNIGKIGLPDSVLNTSGKLTQEELLANLGDGLYLTEVSGLHAGANPISGDFSLLSRGFEIKGGRVVRAVEEFTVAGNFYQLLKDITDVGGDLLFEASPIGSPSVLVKRLDVAGA